MVAINERELERRIGITIDALQDVREHVRKANQADDAEQIAQPSPWLERLIFVALVLLWAVWAVGVLLAILYFGGLL